MGYLNMPTALAAQERVTDRFTSLLRSTSDGSGKVPHLTWTVGETGAHVLGSLRLYPEMLARTATGWEDLSAGESENARFLAGIPEREPQEIADAILFFASPRSDYITGQVLSVSGGLTFAG